MRPMILGLALILWGMCGAGAAELIYPFHYGGWDGGAYRYDDTEDFSHCSITADYESGVTLGIGVTSDYKLRIVLVNNEWNLEKGEKYSANIYIDNQYLSAYPAESFDNTIVMIDLGGDANAFEWLRWGRILTIDAGRRTLRFTLTDTYAALAKVSMCVELAHAVGEAGTNPFSGGGGSPLARALPSPAPEAAEPGTEAGPGEPGTGPGHAAIERELVEFILSAAGIKGPRFLSSAQMRGMADVAHAWVVGETLGFVFQSPRGAGTVAAQMGDLLAALGEDCGGDFATASKATEGVGRFALKQGFGSCREGDGAATTYVTAVFGDQVVTVFGHTGRGGAAETALRSNAGVTDALLAILH
jgi:hypothetical protein